METVAQKVPVGMRYICGA